MRASNKAYEEVAEHCSQFNSVANTNSYTDSYTDSYSDDKEVSCVSCSHFDEDKYCKLDLFDPITKNHKIEG